MAGQVARGGLPLELLHGNADALLLHDRRPERRQAVDPLGPDVLHVGACAGHEDHQQVHDQPGVDAGAQHRDAIGLGQPVQFGGQLGLPGLGVGHLLGGGDDVDAQLHDQLDLVEGLAGVAVGGQQDHVGGAPAQHLVDVALQHHVAASGPTATAPVSNPVSASA